MNHRLNGSTSPVLTATCLSYGSLCDFIFFPQPTWRSHPSTDFDAKWLKRRRFTNTCAFWGKNCNCLKPLTLRPPKPPKFAQFWSGLRKFPLDFALNIGGLTSKHPLFFIGAQQKCHSEQAMWGWEIQICTQILHRGYRSRDIARAQ